MHLLFIFKSIENEPHGVLHISSFVKQHGHRISMVVATEEDPVEAALRLKPDVVGYSVYSGVQGWYLGINRRLKAQLPGVLSLFGGPHPTYYPDIIEEEGVDAVCRGEGEYALLYLLDALQKGDPIEHLPNWWLKLDGRIVRNSLIDLELNLDKFPFPDRALLYQAHPPSLRSKVKPFIAGRGCPFDCSYCFNKAFADLYQAGRRTRWRSVDNVISEILEVKEKYPLEFLTFMDDTFVLNPKWLKEFAAKYKAAVGLPFWCQVRADLIVRRPETVKMLQQAGCASASFGLETANDRLRNAILKRNMTKEQILEASRLLRQHGIALMTNNMLGLPTGSLEADFETLELNAQCRPAYANVFLFQPYPGTELGEMAFREGWTMGTFDDLSGSHTENTIIKFGSDAEKRQIENLQKLFALATELPFLIPFIKLLIKLPANRLYWMIYKLWKGYAMKRRMFPHKLTLWEYAGAFLQFMRIRAQ
ncbi:MAG: B12-binding domain-containing radical SAM protein [Anaerolineae bacterium]